jgi:integrase
VAKAKALARGNFLPSAQPRDQKRYLSHKEVGLLAESARVSELMILVMAYVGGRLVEAPPKSKKAREIPIPTTLRDPLHKLVTNLRGPEALLFSTKHGAPLRYSKWRQDVFDPAVKAAGLHGLTPHGLRNTYAALVVQSGANPKVLQSTMGHSDIRLTLDTYGGLFGDDLDTLVAGLDKAIRGAV